MAPSLCGYRIIVVDANRVYACFAYGTGPTSLGLLQEDSHYDALISLPAFFGKSYFSGQCLKPYNDQGQHACPANRSNHCKGLLQDGCPDHNEAYLLLFTTSTPALVAVIAVASSMSPSV